MNLKILIRILVLVFWFNTSKGQENQVKDFNYHLVYIELSDNNNRKGIIEKLNKLYRSFTDNGDYFISLLSDGEKGHFFRKNDNHKQLYNLINDINTSLPNMDNDLRNLVAIWNKEDITYLDKNGKTHLLYKKLFIHYFLSPGFYDISGTYFSSKLLNINNINDINDNTYSVEQIFYFNGNDIEEEFFKDIVMKYEQGLNGSVKTIFLRY